MTILATATAAHPVHVSPHAIALAVGALGLYLLVLRAKSGLMRARLSRAVTRSFAPGPSGRRHSVHAHRLAERAVSSRRASRKFRKALLISALITAAVLFVHLHPNGH
jgi:hypothetical protein